MQKLILFFALGCLIAFAENCHGQHPSQVDGGMGIDATGEFAESWSLRAKSPEVSWTLFSKMENETRDSLEEDLKILWKVLSNSLVDERKSYGYRKLVASEVDGTGSSDVKREWEYMQNVNASDFAMVQSSNSGQSTIRFLEGYGICFSLPVGFRVTGKSANGAKGVDGTEPAKSLSAWEKAKLQVSGNVRPRVAVDLNLNGVPKYDVSRVRSAVKAIQDALVEAKNIRALSSSSSANLDKNFFVSVTLVGPVSNEPNELTLRVSVGDIQALASGGMEVDEFAAKIEQSIPASRN